MLVWTTVTGGAVVVVVVTTGAFCGREESRIVQAL